jgi:hypothetical protein
MLDPDLGGTSHVAARGYIPRVVVVMPTSDDLVRTFYDALNAERQETGYPLILYRVEEVRPQRALKGVQVEIVAREDYQDGRGPRQSDRVILQLPRLIGGESTLLFSVRSVPLPLLSSESDLLASIQRSVRVNDRVLSAITRADDARAAAGTAANLDGNATARRAAAAGSARGSAK